MDCPTMAHESWICSVTAESAFQGCRLCLRRGLRRRLSLASAYVNSATGLAKNEGPLPFGELKGLHGTLQASQP